MAATDTEELALELKYWVGRPLGPHNLAKKPRLRALVALQSGVTDRVAVAAIKARVQASIAQVEDVRLKRFSRSIKGYLVSDALRILLSLEKSAENLSATARRNKAIQVLHLRMDVETWRRPDGPEQQLMRAMAKVLLQTTAGARLGGILSEEITIHLHPDGNPARSSHKMTIFATGDGFSSIGPIGRLATPTWSPGIEGRLDVATTMHTPRLRISYESMRSIYLHFDPLSQGETTELSWDVNEYETHRDASDGGGDTAYGMRSFSGFRYPVAVQLCRLRLIFGDYEPSAVTYYQSSLEGEMEFKSDVYDGISEHEFNNVSPTHSCNVVWWLDAPRLEC